MPYLEPRGKIVRVSQCGNVARLVIQFDRMDSGPVAPAGIYVDPRSDNERFQLHRAIDSNDLVYTFETFDRTHPLPKVGEVFSYRGWWLPEAMEAALDEFEKWNRKKYPDNGSHDHCLFSWETIASYAENCEGYFSEKYGWITCDSYEKYICSDVYHLRDQGAITSI